jgi:phage terminase large subunit
MDREGFRFLAHIPPEIIESTNETGLRIKLKNGSIIQLIGSDNIDAVMSTNPIGCVFAEYSLQDPRGWDYISPILVENGGWAIFDFTPRGRNHAYDLFERAKKLQAEGDRDWFCQRLTIEDTGAISLAQIDKERLEGRDEDLLRQEYWCSFTGAMQGSYYGPQMDTAEREGRICRVPWQPELAVDTWWDLGMHDPMAIIFTQNVGREVHVINYFEMSGGGLPVCARAMQRKPYIYGKHYGPHDIQVREMGSGKSRIETAAELGIKFEMVPNIGLQDGIDATRSFLNRCWFDNSTPSAEDKAEGWMGVERLRNALVTYHKTWDEARKLFSAEPYRDWSTHPSDAMRYLAVGHKITQSARAVKAERRLVSEGEASWMAS